MSKEKEPSEPGQHVVHAVSKAKSPDTGREITQVGLKKLKPTSKGLASDFDAHVHTDASDGERSPRDLALDVENGDYHVVVADHYTTLGAVKSMWELARIQNEKGSSMGEVIPGIEFSVDPAVSVPEMQKMHVLGLAVHPSNNNLNAWLSDFNRDREADIGRAVEAISGLEEGGLRFTGKIMMQIGENGDEYRVLARNLLKKKSNHDRLRERFGLDFEGDPFSLSKNKRIGIEKKIAGSLRDEYGELTTSRPSVKETIDLIHGADGLAVVAHPYHSAPELTGYPRDKLTGFMKKIKELGFDAVEAYHPAHTSRQGNKLVDAASEAGLMVTAGSDAHSMDDELGVFKR